MTFGIITALLAIAGGLLYRSRLKSMGGGGTALTDDMIRRLESGEPLHLEEDEPLDMDEIREEERRFFEETWDEPDEI